MNPIEIKLIVKEYDNEGISEAYGSEFRAINAVLDCLESGPKTIYVTPEVRLSEVEETLVEHFTPKFGDPAIEVRSGVSGGCYGARSGSIHKGLTLYIDALEFSDHFIDDEGDEVANIHALLENMGTLRSDLDGETLIEAAEMADADGFIRNNTYNYMGQDAESVHPLQHVDFALIPNADDSAFLVCKFHGGGDIRGKYTDWHVYEFSPVCEAWIALSPLSCLKYQNAD